MNSPKSPPPGSVPGMMPSPDVASMMQQGMAQKLGGQSGTQPQMPSSQMGDSGQSGFQHQQAPREVTDVPNEVMRMGQDLFTAFKEMLGLSRPPKSQEEVAELQQFHQSWQGLTAEQQAVAQERIQKELERKEMMKQEEEMKKQQAEQQAQQNQVVIPHGKVSGQAALDKMQQDRKGMGGTSG